MKQPKVQNSFEIIAKQKDQSELTRRCLEHGNSRVSLRSGRLVAKILFTSINYRGVSQDRLSMIAA